LSSNADRILGFSVIGLRVTGPKKQESLTEKPALFRSTI
jgi:hypothetical protein